MESLNELAELVRQRNAVSKEIAARIGRPALIGHVGEYIAARVFEIELNVAANARGLDGRFRSGPLSGRSVNIKWYGRQEGMLDLLPDGGCDFVLAMTGPRVGDADSESPDRPWRIEHVYLFSLPELLADRGARGARIGIATSVPQRLWSEAEIFPRAASTLIHLTEAQRAALALFGPSALPT